jgi:hypothetical protein
MRGTDIVGYTYKADTYHPQCVLEVVKADHPLDYPLASTILPTDTPEDILRTVAKSMRLAGTLDLDIDDEHTFDSGDFPKAIFASQVESDNECCGACRGPLVLRWVSDDEITFPEDKAPTGGLDTWDF